MKSSFLFEIKSLTLNDQIKEDPDIEIICSCVRGVVELKRKSGTLKASENEADSKTFVGLLS